MTDREHALQAQVDALTQELGMMSAKYQQSCEAYETLLFQLKQLIRDRFGSKSERFIDSEDPTPQLFDENAAPVPNDEPAVAGAEDESESDDDNVVHIAAHVRRQNRRQLSKDLPRREVVISVEEAQKHCSCGCGKRVINHLIHEWLHYRPAIFEVVVEKREVWACPRGCAGEVVTAPRPAHMLPKSKIGESLLAHLIVSKFDDRQPFYHLEKQLEHRAGLLLSRQSMARAAIKSAEVLQPLVNLLKDRMIEYDIGGFDATTLQVLKEPARSPQVKSSVYCMRGGPPDEAVTVYAYNALDHKRFIDDWFAGFSGTLHCDADPLFERLFAREGIHPSYCHAHARRQFEPIAKASKTPGLAVKALQYYRRLYRIERMAKQQDLTPEERLAFRQQHSQPLMDAFHAWLVEHAPTTLPKSPLGKAFQYVLTRWEDFNRFLLDGRLEVDNNLTEQAVKPLVIARKNFLFADSVAGAHALCVHMSLIRTAKQHGLDPYRYYEAILTALPHCTTVEEMEVLLPWRIVLNVQASQCKHTLHSKAA